MHYQRLLKLRTQSFRLRIALWMVTICSGLLLFFFVLSSIYLYQRKLGNIDQAMLGQIAGQLSRRTPPNAWENVQSQLDLTFAGFVARQPDVPHVLLLVYDGRDGRLVFRTPHWPRSLYDSRLPQPIMLPGPWSNRSPQSGPPPDLGPPPDAGPPDFGPPGMGEGMPPPPRFQEDQIQLSNLEAGGQHWRFGAVRHPGATVWLGFNLSQSAMQRDRAMWRFFLGFLAAIGVVAVLSWWVAGRAVRPLQQLSRDVAEVNASGLDRRLDVNAEDIEFRQLVEVFNGMLDRLQRSFDQATRFSGDAAHELKTPLAILQGGLERCVDQAEAGSPLQGELSQMMDEVRRLDHIVRKLLLLSRADAGQLRLSEQQLDLTRLLQELQEDLGMMAAERPVAFQLPPSMPCLGDADLLGQVLHNLGSNAVKYGNQLGWIKLEAAEHDGFWQIDIGNAAPELLASQKERLFERFFRADLAHSRQIDGVGLGLSLSREIARAHRGDLLLLRAEAGEVWFRLLLPKFEAAH